MVHCQRRYRFVLVATSCRRASISPRSEGFCCELTLTLLRLHVSQPLYLPGTPTMLAFLRFVRKHRESLKDSNHSWVTCRGTVLLPRGGMENYMARDAGLITADVVASNVQSRQRAATKRFRTSYLPNSCFHRPHTTPGGRNRGATEGGASCKLQVARGASQRERDTTQVCRGEGVGVPVAW